MPKLLIRFPQLVNKWVQKFHNFELEALYFTNILRIKFFQRGYYK
jgi:hypothetical protein